MIDVTVPKEGEKVTAERDLFMEARLAENKRGESEKRGHVSASHKSRGVRPRDALKEIPDLGRDCVRIPRTQERPRAAPGLSPVRRLHQGTYIHGIYGTLSAADATSHRQI